MTTPRQVFREFIYKHHQSYIQVNATVGQRPFDYIGGNFSNFKGKGNDIDDKNLKEAMFAELNNAAIEFGKIFTHIKKDKKYDSGYVVKKYKEITDQLYVQLNAAGYDKDEINKIAINFLTNAHSKYIKQANLDISDKKNSEINNFLILMQSVFFKPNTNQAIVDYLVKNSDKIFTEKSIITFKNIVGKENFINALRDFKTHYLDKYNNYVQSFQSSGSLVWKNVKDYFFAADKLESERLNVQPIVKSVNDYFNNLENLFKNENNKNNDLYKLLLFPAMNKAPLAELNGRLFYQVNYQVNKQPGILDARKTYDFGADDFVKKLAKSIKSNVLENGKEVVNLLVKSIEGSKEWGEFWKKRLGDQSFSSLDETQRKAIYKLVLGSIIYRAVGDANQKLYNEMKPTGKDLIKFKKITDEISFFSKGVQPVNVEVLESVTKAPQSSPINPKPMTIQSPPVLKTNVPTFFLNTKDAGKAQPAPLRNIKGERVKPRTTVTLSEPDQKIKNTQPDPELQRLKHEIDVVTKNMEEKLAEYAYRLMSLSNVGSLTKELSKFIANYQNEVSKFSEIKDPTKEQCETMLKVLKVKNIVLNTKVKQIEQAENNAEFKPSPLFDQLLLVFAQVSQKFNDLKELLGENLYGAKFTAMEENHRSMRNKIIIEFAKLSEPEQDKMLKDQVGKETGLLKTLTKVYDDIKQASEKHLEEAPHHRNERPSR